MKNRKCEIEKIISKMACSKDFRCCKSNFKQLSKVEDVGIESFIKCLENDAWQCEFAFAFGDCYLCKCPLRIYILKKLGK